MVDKRKQAGIGGRVTQRALHSHRREGACVTCAWTDGHPTDPHETKERHHVSHTTTGRSCFRFALYPHMCHAEAFFGRRALWYLCLCCVPTVTAIRSSKAVRPRLAHNGTSAKMRTVLVIPFSFISRIKGDYPRSKSRLLT